MKELKTATGGEAWFIEIKNKYESQRTTLKNLSRQPSVDGGDDCLPKEATEVAISFRVAANALKFAMTQRSGRTSPGMKRPGGGTVEEPVEEEDLTDEELFSSMLGQWVEVECLLRVQLRSQEHLEEARERVKGSLAFDADLGSRAASSGILKGTIFQALLRKADGDDVGGASVGLDVSDADWAALADGAAELRRLVRIKVQDDNDLKAANGALSSCADFFRNLALYGSRHSMQEMAVVQKLEEPT